MLASLLKGIAPVALRQPFRGPIASYVRHNSTLYPARSITLSRPAQFTPSPSLIQTYDPSRPNLWKNIVEKKQETLPRLGSEETWTEREGRLATLSQHNNLHNTYTGMQCLESSPSRTFINVYTNRATQAGAWQYKRETLEPHSPDCSSSYEKTALYTSSSGHRGMRRRVTSAGD